VRSGLTKMGSPAIRSTTRASDTAWTALDSFFATPSGKDHSCKVRRDAGRCHDASSWPPRPCGGKGSSLGADRVTASASAS
jgi:hypothetical protein